MVKAKVRRRLQGTVVSNKMDKTIVVQVDSYRRHRIYKKPVRTQRISWRMIRRTRLK